MPIIVVGAQVPLTVPGNRFDSFDERVGPCPIVRASISIADTIAHRREVAVHDGEKPPEPHTFPAALDSDAVQPVIPIARTDQGQSVGTSFAGRVLDGLQAMLVD